MCRPQPLHLLPGLGIIDEALQELRPSWLAAGLLLNSGSAPTKGGQVMFRPQPLHQLPTLPCHVFPACARPASRSEPQTTWLAHLSSLGEAVTKVLSQLRTTVSPQPFLDS